jgi:glycosyltransferase involved in cell wall biosynthesis
MAHILIIYKQFPAPAVGHAGGEALFRLMEALHRRGHRLSLVARIKDEESPHLAAVRPLCEAIYTVPHHQSLPGPRLWAFLASYWRLRRMAGQALREMRPDLVHVEITQTALALLGLPRPPGSIRTQDVNWFLLEQKAGHSPGLRRGLWLTLARLARPLEAWLYRRYELVLAISEGDRRLLVPCCAPRPVLLVPLAPAVHSTVAGAPALPPGPTVLFVGAMARTFNQQGVRWFLEQVWPRVLAEVPEARFVVAGGNPPEWLTARQDDHLLVTGFVDDLTPWYRAAAVCVSPLLVAGGLLQKVVDALALGVPVVATSVSNHGLAATPGEQLLVADTPAAFAEAVVRLLRDPAERARLGQAGQQFIQERYDLETTVDLWHEKLLALLR